MKRSTNRKRWIVGLMGVLVALCLVPVVARAVDGVEGDSAPKANAVAKIGEVEYESLDAAIKGSKTGDEITLLADASLSTTSFPSDKTLVINGDNHVIDADEAYLNIAGDVTFKNSTVNFHGVPNGNWMYIYMASNGSLTFDSSTVSIDGSKAADNTTALYFPEPDTPKASVSIINSSFTAKNCRGNGISWGGKPSNGYNTLTLEGSNVTIDNCAEKNTKGGGGIIGTFDINATDSTLTVTNNKSYGSNGSNYYLSNTDLIYNNNGTHGVSATDLVVENGSTISADGNGHYGVYVNGKFVVDGTSSLNVTHNSSAEDCAGLKLNLC